MSDYIALILLPKLQQDLKVPLDILPDNIIQRVYLSSRIFNGFQAQVAIWSILLQFANIIIHGHLEPFILNPSSSDDISRKPPTSRSAQVTKISAAKK